MSLIGELICYHVSYYLLSKNRLGQYQDLSSLSQNVDEYDHWRDDILRKSLNDLPHIPLNGKTVVDFGCGGGELSFLLKASGAEKVYGVDLNSETLRRAREMNSNGSSVEFLLGTTSSIPLPRNSIDLIFCISVLEHVMEVDSILREWHRILRRKGQVLIHWSAWHSPDASHLSVAIPIPYAQCLFSERTLALTVARITLSQVYKPKFWDYNPQTGLRKEVHLRDQYTPGFLNKMSIRDFDKKLTMTGLFEKTHYQCHPPTRFPYIRPLLKIPFCREHLSSFSTYILTKNDADANYES